MALQERIQQELKAAMLAKDADTVGTLRLLKSAIGYAQIEKKTDALSDAEVVSLTQKEIKKRRDSIEQFQSGGRPELAAKESAEISVLEKFLPQPLSSDELDQLIRAVIQESGATSKKEMGAVIKAVQAKAGGRADGKTISGMVGKLLP
jgi:uncharacterized protein YqeY